MTSGTPFLCTVTERKVSKWFIPTSWMIHGPNTTRDLLLGTLYFSTLEEFLSQEKVRNDEDHGRCHGRVSSIIYKHLTYFLVLPSSSCLQVGGRPRHGVHPGRGQFVPPEAPRRTEGLEYLSKRLRDSPVIGGMGPVDVSPTERKRTSSGSRDD